MPSGKSKNGCLCCDDATNLWTMIKEEKASLDDFDVEEPVPEGAEDGQLDEDARICSLKFSAQ